MLSWIGPCTQHGKARAAETAAPVVDQLLIAFDVTPLQNAHRHRGIGTYVRGLASRLANQREIPIEFWAWTGPLPLEVRPPHTLRSLRRIPMPEYRGAWAFAQMAMRLRARQTAAKAVHITDPSALVPIGGVHLLTTVYDLIPLKEGLSSHRLISRMGYRSYLKAVQRADTLFAISQQTAGDIVNLLRVPEERIRIARPGVDLPPAGGQSTDHSRPYFLFLGGPNPNKNLGVILDAMTICTDLGEELLVAGHWLQAQLQQLNQTIESKGLAGRVRHIGFVPDGELHALVRGATALVVPSLQEGFGLPVAEGLAAGALVVHSTLPVLVEISIGAALTFDPTSPTELAACLRRAANDQDVAQLRERGRARARDLTWDAALATTLASYRAVGA